jgi:hypothetical protein
MHAFFQPVVGFGFNSEKPFYSFFVADKNNQKGRMAVINTIKVISSRPGETTEAGTDSPLISPFLVAFFLKCFER